MQGEGKSEGGRKGKVRWQKTTKMTNSNEKGNTSRREVLGREGEGEKMGAGSPSTEKGNSSRWKEGDREEGKVWVKDGCRTVLNKAIPVEGKGKREGEENEERRGEERRRSGDSIASIRGRWVGEWRLKERLPPLM